MTFDPDAQPWVLCVTMTIKAERREEFFADVQAVIDEMRFEKSFITTDLCVDPADENRFFLYEVWQSREDFWEVQLKRPYRTDYMNKIDDMMREPRHVAEWRQIRADHRLASKS